MLKRSKPNAILLVLLGCCAFGGLGYWMTKSRSEAPPPSEDAKPVHVDATRQLTRELATLDAIEREATTLHATRNPDVKAVAAADKAADRNDGFWKTLPRTKRSFYELVFFYDTKRTVKNLLRQVELNAGDRPIPFQRTTALRHLLDKYHSMLERLEDLETRIRTKELRIFVEAGGGTELKRELAGPIDDTELPPATTPNGKYIRKALGKKAYTVKIDPRKHDIGTSYGNKLIGLASKELPVSYRARKLALYLRQEQASLIAEWFVQVGTLDPKARKQLMDRIWAVKNP